MSRCIDNKEKTSKEIQYIKFNDDIIGKGGQKKYGILPLKIQ